MHYCYENEGGVMVVNHTIDADGSDHAGIRWYELSNNGGDWIIQQQGTYAPDKHHRWMGSIGRDKFGNIAIGYSLSSETAYPSVRYSGRYADDPPGMMTLHEKEVIAGSGYQTNSYGRWGDYSMMSLDPIDGITFWYTQQYFEITGYQNWKTRVVAFRLTDDPYVSIGESQDQDTHLFNICPNPFTDQLTIHTEPGFDASYMILSVIGNIHLTDKIKKSNEIIDTGSLNPGAYFLIILDRKGTVVRTEKIIKM